MRGTQPAQEILHQICRIAKPSSRIAMQCAAMQALERTLYRSLRRLAQHLDGSAARRGALTSLPANYYDRQARRVVDMDMPERDADDAAQRGAFGWLCIASGHSRDIDASEHGVTAPTSPTKR